MLENCIEFQAPKYYIDLKEDLPQPIKFNLPDWYKKLVHNRDNLTVKGCRPFFETLTSGYLLRLPADYKVKFNKFRGDTDVQVQGIHNTKKHVDPNLNVNVQEQHDKLQLEGSPLIKKNLDKHIQKFINPWIIKTPPGYSCLFVPPFNNADDRFSIIPGIVHTDKYHSEINFPFTINGDKYPCIEDTFEKGTPYVQVIPFKRSSWKMKISSKDSNHFYKWGVQHVLKLVHLLKSKWWSQTSWK